MSQEIFVSVVKARELMITVMNFALPSPMKK